MTVCSRCGKENQDHYKFCLGCGSDLTAQQARPSAAAAPEPSAPHDNGQPPAYLQPPTQPVNPPAPAYGQGPTVVAERRPVALPEPPQAFAATVATAHQGRSMGPGAGPSLAASPYGPGPAASLAVAAPAAPMRACPSCGKPVPYEFVFCGSCGTRLGAAAPPAAGAGLAGLRPMVSQAPAPQPRGKLVLIRPDGGEGGAMQLAEGETLIGRNEGALFEADSYLSPKHAYFLFRGSQLVVRDAGSLNGVFVKMSGEEEIADGEVFRLGQELLRFDVIRPAQPLDDGTEVMGSPNPGYWGRLSVILGRGQDGSAFPLFGESMIIGRERGDILFPEDGYVSGTHARVSRRDTRYFLSDLNSSNGSFLRIRGERALKSGAFLLLGQQLFRVQYS